MREHENLWQTSLMPSIPVSISRFETSQRAPPKIAHLQRILQLQRNQIDRPKNPERGATPPKTPLTNHPGNRQEEDDPVKYSLVLSNQFVQKLQVSARLNRMTLHHRLYPSGSVAGPPKRIPLRNLLKSRRGPPLKPKRRSRSPRRRSGAPQHRLLTKCAPGRWAPWSIYSLLDGPFFLASQVFSCAWC